jgi:hypothetical protein
MDNGQKYSIIYVGILPDFDTKVVVTHLNQYLGLDKDTIKKILTRQGQSINKGATLDSARATVDKLRLCGLDCYYQADTLVQEQIAPLPTSPQTIQPEGGVPATNSNDKLITFLLSGFLSWVFAGVLLTEAFGIAAAIGFEFQSWFAFGGALVGFFLLLSMNKNAATIFLAILAFGWGYIGYCLGDLLSNSAAIVWGFLGLLAGIGCHLPFFKLLHPD